MSQALADLRQPKWAPILDTSCKHCVQNATPYTLCDDVWHELDRRNERVIEYIS